MRAIYGWLAEASAEQRRALLAACLGWMLDSMDVMLYALVLPQVQREMRLSAGASGAMMSLTLLASAFGGGAFGWLADRLGRTRALTASMLVYSVATALCGLTHTAAQLALCRVLLGLGMGGEWAAGAALVAESWPGRHRAKALAVVQSFWAVGYALGAAVAALVLPRYGWRAVFFVGIAPALVTLWVRRRVREPELWRERSGPYPFRALFRGSLGRRALICAGMNAASLFAFWGLFTWTPRLLSLPVGSGGHGFTVAQTSSWTIVMQAGAFLGYLAFGWIADRVSRKAAYIGYLLLAATLVPLFAFLRGPQALLAVAPLMGFFGAGYFSGFGVIASELFPTPIRALAMGLAYNAGRIVSAAAPYLVGRISERAGLDYALCATSVGFLLAAGIAALLPSAASPELFPQAAPFH